MRRFHTLQAELAAASNEALERFREESKKTTLRLVEMESSYLTVDFFRRLPHEVEKGGIPSAAAAADRYGEGHFRRIGSNVTQYVAMVSELLKNSIPKAVVHCQVREAKRSLLDHFYTQVGKKEVLFFSPLSQKAVVKCFVWYPSITALSQKAVVKCFVWYPSITASIENHQCDWHSLCPGGGSSGKGGYSSSMWWLWSSKFNSQYSQKKLLGSSSGKGLLACGYGWFQVQVPYSQKKKKII